MVGIAAGVCVGLTVATAPALAEPTPVPADRPLGTYVIVDDSSGGVIHDHSGSHYLYVNGCHDGGCTITPGVDDSRTDHSSIPSSTSHLDPWPYGETSWNLMMDCVRDLYSPFNVIVTDIDPGPDTPHFEAIAAGRPQDVGMPSGVGGVAPFSCGVIENAITFTFAGVIGNEPQIICEIVGQESAHAFGLDHEYLCEDPMTYLPACGPRTFQDFDARCGEFAERDCQCGGATQNSYQRILAVFGDAVPPTPPEVSIDAPADSAEVRPGFAISVAATDNVEVKRLELLIDGEVVDEETEPPYEFRAPGDLASATVEIEARAYDDRGTMGSDAISVTIGAPCQSNSDCGDGEGCVDGRCVPYGVEGGLGDDCTEDSECLSGICVEQFGACTELCDPALDSCPRGFDCLAVAGGGGACFEGEDEGGCGCRAGGRSAAPLAPLALFAVLVVVRRRRRGH